MTLTWPSWIFTALGVSEFCQWVRSLRPNLPVLLATGRNQPPLRIAGPTWMIPRPYLPTEVAAKVRDILSRVGV